MILILTNAQDSTATLVEAQLTRLGFDFIHLNTERFGTEFRVEFACDSTSSEIQIHTPSREVAGKAIRAIWNRRPLPPIPLDRLSDPAGREFAAAELKATLDGALLALNGLWVSHPQAIRTAAHKLAQLRVAGQLGFSIPETCISMNLERIRAFAAHLKHNDRRLVAKIVAQGPPRATTPEEQYVVFTQILSDGDLNDDDALSVCPAIYQEYVEKQFELRVTVVGQKVFACEIHSQVTARTQTDWRRYDLPKTPHRIHTLSPETEARCLALTKHFGLMFAAIDLVVKPDGAVVFLEINPNGQWGWIEELTGLPIAAALAELLGKGGE